MLLCNVLFNTNNSLSSDDKEDEQNSNHLLILFKYENRLFTLKRQPDECLEVLVKRIKINLQKAFKTNKDKKSSNNKQDYEDFKLEFYKEGQPVDLKIQNQDFWLDGSQMHINQNVYNIKINQPNLLDLRLPKIILSDYPTYPILDIVHGNIIDSEFLWFKSKDKIEWIPLNDSNEFCYQVKTEDIGCYLKVVCTPRNQNENEGITKEAISEKAIQKGPVDCPFEKRAKHCQNELQPNQYRIVSYNLLADLYADSEYSRDVLYSYCKNCYLNFDYRKCLIIKELLSYRSDIYFLQELDSIFYEKALQPILLSTINHGSYFVSKEMNSEGLCIFYNQSRFRCLEQEAHTHADLLLNSEMFSDLKNKINENQNLMERIKKLKNTFQLILLESNIDNRRLLLCNLHLYSKDDADHIRLFQSFITLKYIEFKLDQFNKNNLDTKIAVILSGDFNSTPEFGVCKLILTKQVDSSLEDFQSNEMEIIKDFNLKHGLNFQSACGYPRYTHFAQHFEGCLDYIFYDHEQMTILNVVPMPDHEDVVKETALPNEKIPSDHLPLICTIQWK